MVLNNKHFSFFPALYEQMSEHMDSTTSLYE